MNYIEHHVSLEELRSVRQVPSSDGTQPRYRFVLLNLERTDWLASTENLEEGIPAFRRMLELEAASEIVRCEP